MKTKPNIQHRTSNPGHRIKKVPPVVARDEKPGRVAYEAYCEARGWKGVNGDDLPAWSKVKTFIKFAWMRSARAVLELIGDE